MTRTRRILKDFTITEISAVTKPAVEGALVAIIKADTRSEAGLEEFSQQYLHHAALPTRQPETTAMTIRKASDDAMTSMNSYIAKRDRGVSRATSAEQWRKLNPDQYAALNATAGMAAPVTKRSASVDFMKLVDEVQRDQHCSKTTAMEIARKVHHAEFVKFQQATA